MIVVPGSRKSTWITPPAPKNTVAASFSTDTRVLLSCAGTPQTDTCIRIINVAPTFLLLSPCREEKSHIRFLSEIKLQENVKSLSFHICREHGEERICTNLPVFKNISNVIHTFLWNANFTSKISLSDQTNFFLISSSTRPLRNSSVAVTGRQTLYHTNQILQLRYFTSVRTTTRSAQSIYEPSPRTTCIFRWISDGARLSAVQNSITARRLNRAEWCQVHGPVSCKTRNEKPFNLAICLQLMC